MTNYTTNRTHEVRLPCHDVQLDGFLHLQASASGIVIFVHGSGSSRFSVRNQHVAKILNNAGLATLLFDLFTPVEDQIDTETRSLRFDLPFLATRLSVVTRWCEDELPALSIGYFGASTGAAAAILAASMMHDIKAVVSRGGRPDLASTTLGKLATPTLLIVGSEDHEVIYMNQIAQKQIQGISELVIVPGASHLFEEPGTLDQVATLAQHWFINYLK